MLPLSRHCGAEQNEPRGPRAVQSGAVHGAERSVSSERDAASIEESESNCDGD